MYLLSISFIIRYTYTVGISFNLLQVSGSNNEPITTDLILYQTGYLLFFFSKLRSAALDVAVAHLCWQKANTFLKTAVYRLALCYLHIGELCDLLPFSKAPLA